MQTAGSWCAARGRCADLAALDKDNEGVVVFAADSKMEAIADCTTTRVDSVYDTGITL